MQSSASTMAIVYKGARYGAGFLLFFTGLVLIFALKAQPTLANHPLPTPNMSGFAWSSNIGWISFNSTDCDTNHDGLRDVADCVAPSAPLGGPVIPYGVRVDPSTLALSGYAWSPNIGWISFNWSEEAVVGPRFPSDYDPTSGTPSCVNCTAFLDTTTTPAPSIRGWGRAISACPWNGTNCTSSGPGSNSGGWDGWIRFDNNPTAADGVLFRATANPDDLSGFAWGSDVVGWVSFNSKDCDQNNNNFVDTGACGGNDNSTTPIRAYVVKITGLGAFPSVTADSSNFQQIGSVGTCLSNQVFNWILGAGTTQTNYQLQADTDTNPLTRFSVPDLNIPGIGSAQTRSVPISTIASSSTLLFNTNYFWRVRVQNSAGFWSPWANGPDQTPLVTGSFTTSPRPLTSPDFDQSPAQASLDETITFTNTSVPPNGMLITDPTFSWDWTGSTVPFFVNNVSPPTDGDVDPYYTATFLPGPPGTVYRVSLRVVDNGIGAYILGSGGSGNGMCTTIKTIAFSSPLPNYREVSPVGFFENAKQFFADAFNTLVSFVN